MSEPQEKWDKEFETLDEAIQAIEVLKGRLLFGDISNRLSAEHPLAEQHFLAAMAALDTAKAHFRLADYLYEEDDDGDD